MTGQRGQRRRMTFAEYARRASRARPRNADREEPKASANQRSQVTDVPTAVVASGAVARTLADAAGASARNSSVSNGSSSKRQNPDEAQASRGMGRPDGVGKCAPEGGAPADAQPADVADGRAQVDGAGTKLACKSHEGVVTPLPAPSAMTTDTDGSANVLVGRDSRPLATSSSEAAGVPAVVNGDCVAGSSAVSEGLAETRSVMVSDPGSEIAGLQSSTLVSAKQPVDISTGGEESAVTAVPSAVTEDVGVSGASAAPLDVQHANLPEIVSTSFADVSNMRGTEAGVDGDMLGASADFQNSGFQGSDALGTDGESAAVENTQNLIDGQTASGQTSPGIAQAALNPAGASAMQPGTQVISEDRGVANQLLVMKPGVDGAIAGSCADANAVEMSVLDKSGCSAGEPQSTSASMLPVETAALNVTAGNEANATVGTISKNVPVVASQDACFAPGNPVVAGLQTVAESETGLTIAGQHTLGVVPSTSAKVLPGGIPQVVGGPNGGAVGSLLSDPEAARAASADVSGGVHSTLLTQSLAGALAHADAIIRQREKESLGDVGFRGGDCDLSNTGLALGSSASGAQGSVVSVGLVPTPGGTTLAFDAGKSVLDGTDSTVLGAVSMQSVLDAQNNMQLSAPGESGTAAGTEAGTEADDSQPGAGMDSASGLDSGNVESVPGASASTGNGGSEAVGTSMKRNLRKRRPSTARGSTDAEEGRPTKKRQSSTASARKRGANRGSDGGDTGVSSSERASRGRRKSSRGGSMRRRGGSSSRQQKIDQEVDAVDISTILGRNLDDYTRNAEFHARLARSRARFEEERVARNDDRILRVQQDETPANESEDL